MRRRGGSKLEPLETGVVTDELTDWLGGGGVMSRLRKRTAVCSTSLDADVSERFTFWSGIQSE
jgi:hypothetical protein